jgi:hypothetical protein
MKNWKKERKGICCYSKNVLQEVCEMKENKILVNKVRNEKKKKKKKRKKKKKNKLQIK